MLSNSVIEGCEQFIVKHIRKRLDMQFKSLIVFRHKAEKQLKLQIDMKWLKK